MEMKETFKTKNYKVLEVSLKAGESMPLHKASSSALIINRAGKGKLTLNDQEVIIEKGNSFFIEENLPHKMEILEDFQASVILEPDGVISFV